MTENLIVLLVLAVCFLLFYFVPKSNRPREVWLRSSIGFVVALALVALVTYWYRNTESVFGYAFQHNRGLLGGYLCIAVSLLICGLWLLCVTVYNRRKGAKKGEGKP